MWFWHILTPKQNKFIENSVNSNKFLFEMDGTIQPIKFLKINLKTHKSDRIWNASWHSSSNNYDSNNNNKEKEKDKEDHDKLRYISTFLCATNNLNLQFHCLVLISFILVKVFVFQFFFFFSKYVARTRKFQ